MLYKNRYLLALYDNEEHIVGVYDNVKELAQDRGITIQRVRDMLKMENGHLFLIDAFEITDDCFKDVDEAFKKTIETGQLTKISNKAMADIVGISQRTFYRKKSAIKNAHSGNNHQI